MPLKIIAAVSTVLLSQRAAVHSAFEQTFNMRAAWQGMAAVSTALKAAAVPAQVCTDRVQALANPTPEPSPTGLRNGQS